MSLVALISSIYCLADFSQQEEQQLENLPEFNEMIVSLNAERPSSGNYLVSISLKVADIWTDYFLYARWGSSGQNSFKNESTDSYVKIDQDTVEVLKDKRATGFRVKIVGDGVADRKIYSVFVYTNANRLLGAKDISLEKCSISIPVPGLSQIASHHPEMNRICSPTSTTAVIRYLTQSTQLKVADFAKMCLDSGFNIYGNWVFNIAAASAILGKEWRCWVERLSGFNHLFSYLQKGLPVVTSIRGPIPGSAGPYKEGHLVVVRGFDAEQNRVLCMDPAFPSDEETLISYHLPDFIEAWKRRGFIAYIFDKSNE